MAQFPANIDLSTLNGTTGFKLSGVAAYDYSGFSAASAGDVNGDGFADLIIGAPGVQSSGLSGTSYVVFGQASGFAANIDLSSLDGTTGFKLSGAAAGDHSGFSVASAGDVNGDGFADLIVGAGSADPNGSASGASYVVFGKASGFAANVDLSSLDGLTGFKLSGETAYDDSGRSVASAGDVNGDGFADLIVGARGADPHGNSASGASYVVFGQASGFAANIDLSSLDGTTGFKLSGAAAGDFSGVSVASAGDVNGDGFADLIVGAWLAAPHGLQSGASYVVFGKASGFAANIDLSSLDGTTGFKLSGETAGDLSGVSVASAGDVNGDGFADLIVGARFADPHGFSSGASYVVFGQASGFAANIDLSSLDGITGFKLSGAAEFDLSGNSVASAGDVNGDGFADLIVGAFLADPNGTDSGASYVVFGQASGFAANIDLSALDGTTGFKLSGVAANDYSGVSVAAAGDVNGDGFADLIVGARGAGYSGASYVVFGQLPDTAVNRTGTDAGQTLAGGDFADTLSGLGGDDTLHGNGGNDTLDGGAGNDTLIGGTGDDAMSGGLGNDTYVVESLSDTVTEAANAGTDEVRTALASYSLAIANVENLTGTAATGQTLTGDSLANTITGGIGNDTLDGGAGNDTLIGGAGNDTLIGGLGDDIYAVDSLSDVVTEAANAGTDEVRTALASYSLASANVENLTGTAATGQTLTGDSLANTITGGIGNDTLDGGGGNDTLVGGTGDDTMSGGLANDSYIVDSLGDTVTEAANAGTDEVRTALASYSLAANVENLTGTALGGQALTGNALDNVIAGNGGNDILDGGAGNDTLDGGAGDDTMSGGLGNDSYIVDSLLDVVTEAANAGTDEVRTAFASYILAANVENLTSTALGEQALTGNALDNVIAGGEFNDTLLGLGSDDTLHGNGGDDTLIGGTGDDTMIGGTGDDIMVGGAGNDVYIVDSLGDTITEAANAGTDEVETALASYSLAGIANLENLIGTALGGQTLTGNALDNVIAGNGGNDTLDGGAGNDTLIGGTGDDTMSGGLGDDIMVGGAGADALTGGAGNDTYVVDNIGDVVTEAAGQGTDTVQSSLSYTLGADVENLTLTGVASLYGVGNSDGNVLTGNGAANFLVGLAGNDTLDGGAGADGMLGGTGNDMYVVDSAGDFVVESANEGTDTVDATVSYRLTANVENLALQGSADLQGYGNADANMLIGNSGNNFLDGDAGADIMLGGLGNDAYFVDNAGDEVIENPGEGNDTVFSTAHFRLSADIDNLVLVGTTGLQGYGNSLVNLIYGTTGDDILDGAGGADVMIGGAGNDAYIVDNAGDLVVESPGEGTDTVYSTAHFRLAADLEYLVLQGSADLQGYGNSQSNAIVGNTGNNILNGEAGADSMYGGAGNDVYFVDNAGDLVIENVNEGNDTVYASIDYGLTVNVDNLILQEGSAVQATGNSGVNAIFGNSGNNTLDGGGGADVLIGGAGNDTFVFHAGQANGDRIRDFAGNDAGVGDTLSFVGFGTAAAGATFTQIGATNQWTIHSGLGGPDDIITLGNGATVAASDYLFV